eukprot:comp23065_c0_seq1/m.36956 comp23065_c0_seq1/g.36956  ORF comp23065_c0_seq1/g.36956 comp23065_c0_seq1/m.36956 type:complete len:349 (-) comp23065_c0_seq1:172-1218(-)
MYQPPRGYGPPSQGPAYPMGTMGPQISPARQAQIGWMRQQFGTHLREMQPGTIFDLPIQSPTTNPTFSCIVRVTLSPGFPESQPPTIQVLNPSPPVRHEWLGGQGYVVNHPELSRWNMNMVAAQIIKTVAAAVVEVGRAHQPLGGMPSMSGPGPARPTMSGPMGFVTPGQGGPSTASPPQAKPPPSNYPELDKMSAEQLEQLLGDEVKFTEFCMGLPRIKNLAALSKETKENVEHLAASNLARESELEDARRSLAEQHETLQQVRQRYEEMVAKLQALAERQQPQQILEMLKAAAEAKEEETDEYASKFVEGEVDVKDFIKQFKEERTLFHMRAAKAERLDDRLKSGR